MRIIFVFLFIFSLSEMVLSALLQCKRHAEHDDVIYCELSVKSDEQLSISGYESYGNQHYDETESIVVGYKNVTKSFPRGIGKVFGRLKAVDLSLSSLSIIDKFAFENMKNLKELRLYHNEIQKLPADVFTFIPNLEHLNIANNKIAKFDENLLSNLPNLKRFDGSFNNVEEFSANIFKNNPGIREINLKGNKISKIDLSAFETGSWNLDVFDLSNNWKFCDLRFDSRTSTENFGDFVKRAKSLCNNE